MSDLNKMTYLPEEMAEEIRGLKQQLNGLSPDISGTNLDEIEFGSMSSEELSANLTNPGLTNPQYYEDIAEAILELEETSSESPGAQTQDDEKTVLFYDYDGALLYSYTSEEFLALSEMPQNPSHQGLTAQGWNWSFSDAQMYVQKCGSLIVGQTYITDDGKTRIYVHLESPYLEPCIRCSVPTGSGEYITVNWGDGSGDKKIAVSPTYSGASWENFSVRNPISHRYTAAGDYVIEIAVNGQSSISGLANIESDSWLLHGTNWQENLAYCSAITKIELGANIVLSTGNSAANYDRFRCLSNLETITIPLGFMQNIKEDDFGSCTSLKCIILPSDVKTIGDRAFGACTSTIALSIPKGVTKIGAEAFSDCYRLERVTLNAASIGNGAFRSCASMKEVVCQGGLLSIGFATFNFAYKQSDPNVFEPILVYKDVNVIRITRQTI